LGWVIGGSWGYGHHRRGIGIIWLAKIVYEAKKREVGNGVRGAV